MDRTLLRAIIASQLVWVCACGGGTNDGGSSSTNSSSSATPADVAGIRVWPSVLQVQEGQVVPVFATSKAADREVAAEWSVDDPALATIEPVDGGLALLTAKAAGAIVVTASFGDHAATRDAKIAPAGLDDASMEALAAALTDLRSQGTLRSETTALARQATIDPEVAQILSDAMPGARTLAVSVRPGAFDEAGPLTAADLTIGPADKTGPTCDPLVEWGMSSGLARLEDTGVDATLLRGGVKGTCFVSDGDTAAGLYVGEEYSGSHTRVLGAPGDIVTNGPNLIVQVSSETTALFSSSLTDAWIGELRYPEPTPSDSVLASLVPPWLARQGIEVPGSAADGVGLAYLYELNPPAKPKPTDVGRWSKALREAYTCPDCAKALELRPILGAVHVCATSSLDLRDPAKITVLDADGKPASDVRVSFQAIGADDPPVIGTTDSSGTVTLDVYEGHSIEEYQLEAQGADEHVVFDDRPSETTLTLATDITGRFGGSKPAGTKIAVADLCGSMVHEWPGDDCDAPHVHSKTGLWIDGEGPFDDPDPQGCGFGTLE